MKDVVGATIGNVHGTPGQGDKIMEPVWELLDEEVHRSVVLVRALELKINEAVAQWGPDALRVGATKGGVGELYAIYKTERAHLARTAKQSMDAGTGRMRAIQATVNAEAIARVLKAALEDAAVGLDPDQRQRALEALSAALKAESRASLGVASTAAIEGTAAVSPGGAVAV